MTCIKSRLLLLFATFALASSIHSQTIDWATDIAPILYDHCSGCHREGGIGHFSLVGYDNAVTYRNSIADATASKKMPPWKADPEYRRFAHENRLTDSEIQKIQDWVAQGAPSGNLAQAPAAPVFSDESSIGTPDHFISSPPYTMTAIDDEYRCFVIPSNLMTTQYLRGLEVIPSNHEAIHHVLIYEDTTGQAAVLDAQTPEEGYVNFGGPGVATARLIGGWVPGTRVDLLPPNMGFKINPNSDLVVQMHYPAGSAGMMSSAKINMFFTPTNTGIREVRSAPAINHSPFSLVNFPLDIPANTVKTYHAKYKTQTKGTFLAIAPHMHLIGQSMTVFAELPNGDTVGLIRINDWDFHWQGSYTFQKAQVLPAGTTLHAFATYDNTANNDQNPFNPPQNVVQGEGTADEMLVVFFTFMANLPGDENIVLDSTLLQTPVRFVPENKGLSALQIAPNPASEVLGISYQLTEKTGLQVSILDVSGKTVKLLMEKNEANPGIYQEQINIRDLPQGVYWVRISGKNGAVSEQFIKN